MTTLPRADPAREEQELRQYLGDEYRHELLVHYAQTLEREWAGCGSEADFYRSSRAYLYDLTAFAMTGTKEPYLRDLARLLPAPARVLDYGCGIGSDGLRLAEAGYAVAFADFDNPSTRYLRWRLRERGLSADVHDVDGEVPAGFDAAFAFDVLEHVDDPFSLLGELERRAALVMVNVLEPAPGETTLHRDLPVAALLAHARRHGLVRYRRYHGRSHLVAYRPHAPAGPSRAARARMAWLAGRALALSRRRRAARETAPPAP